MSKLWRWFLPAYVLLAPFALVYVAFLYISGTGPTAWKWHEGVLTCVSKRERLPFNAGGQGWSWVVAFADEDQRQRAELRAHEFTHVGQEFACAMLSTVALIALAICGEWTIGVMAGFAGTALFHVVYGGTWLYSMLTHRGWGYEHAVSWSDGEAPAWLKAYRSIPWEVHAYGIEDEFTHGLHARAWGSTMLH